MQHHFDLIVRITVEVKPRDEPVVEGGGSAVVERKRASGAKKKSANDTPLHTPGGKACSGCGKWKPHRWLDGDGKCIYRKYPKKK